METGFHVPVLFAKSGHGATRTLPQFIRVGHVHGPKLLQGSQTAGQNIATDLANPWDLPPATAWEKQPFVNFW